VIEYKEYELEKDNILSLWNVIQEYITDNKINSSVIIIYGFPDSTRFNHAFIKVNENGKCIIDKTLDIKHNIVRIYGYTYLCEVAIMHCKMKGEKTRC
jgi:hypothetical protein